MLKEIVSTSLLASAISTTALAQTSAATPPRSNVSPSNTTGDIRMEEVLVTARKREENVQDTPIAVSAYSGALLDQKGITRISDAVTAAPNVVFDASAPISGNAAAPSVFIRGVGQIDFTVNTDPGVGIYVDGVYLGKSVGSLLELVDLDRVEVLRGPQGTLFGRNSIGGAIHLISKRPEREFGGTVGAGFGSDERMEVQGAINLPLSDTLFTRFTGAARRQDGNVKNLFNGQDLNDTNVNFGRVQVLWEPADELSVDWSADYTRQHENGPGNVALRLFGDAVPGRPDSGVRATNLGARVNLQPQGEAFLAGCTPQTIDTSRRCFGQAWLQGTEANNSGYPSVSENDIWGTALNVNYRFSPAVALKSISAYREIDARFQRDSDLTPFTVLQTNNEQQQHQFSQEFNLSGAVADVGYVIGAYYFSEKAREPVTLVQPGGNGALIQSDFQNFVDNDNWAVFGEWTYDLTPKLQFTAGGRYTEETKRYSTLQRFVAFNNPAVEVLRLVNEPGAQTKADEFTKRLSVRYKPIGETLSLYATFADGFKSGGFNSRYLSPTPDLRSIAYRPEFLKSYEVGAKFTDPTQTLRLNVAAFHNNYEDIQVNVNSPLAGGARSTVNAAQATIDGAEAELFLLLTSRFTLNGSVGYLDAGYDRIDATDPLLSVNKRFARVPEWSANLGVEYTAALWANAGELTGRIDWSYRSDAAGDAINAPEIEMPAYHLVNAVLTYRMPDRPWTLSLAGTNLTDEEYLISSNENARLGYAEGIYARKREWVLRVKYDF